MRWATAPLLNIHTITTDCGKHRCSTWNTRFEDTLQLTKSDFSDIFQKSKPLTVRYTQRSVPISAIYGSLIGDLSTSYTTILACNGELPCITCVVVGLDS